MAPEPSGLLLIDKPEGPTSHDVIETLRRSLGVRRCGHAGTLDPFASGLLVIGLGRATRLLRFLTASDKSYEGLIELGLATDTDDRTGSPLGPRRQVAYAPEDLARSLEALSGRFEQICPDYSARKHEGIPHYRLARKGRQVPKRPVLVRAEWHECSPVPPASLSIRVTVSTGTYIRALARDLGNALGCGGHLAALRRVRSGPFRVDSAALPTASPEALRSAILPLEAIPLGLPSVTVGESALTRIRCGGAIPWPEASGAAPAAPEILDGQVEVLGGQAKPPQAQPDGWVRILGPSGALAALAQIDWTPPLTSPVGHPSDLPGLHGPPRLQPRIVL